FSRPHCFQGRGQGFESPPGHWCDVSGHRGHLSQDIVDRCSCGVRLVVATRIERQLAEQLTVLADDPDVCVGNEQPDALTLVRSTLPQVCGWYGVECTAPMPRRASSDSQSTVPPREAPEKTAPLSVSTLTGRP